MISPSSILPTAVPRASTYAILVSLMPCPPMASINCRRPASSGTTPALGYTMNLPLEDRYLRTRTDLQHQIAVLLGGRTAEEIALGELSTI